MTWEYFNNGDWHGNSIRFRYTNTDCNSFSIKVPLFFAKNILEEVCPKNCPMRRGNKCICNKCVCNYPKLLEVE